MTRQGDIPVALWPLVFEMHGLALGLGICWPQGVPVRDAVPLPGGGSWLTPR